MTIKTNPYCKKTLQIAAIITILFSLVSCQKSLKHSIIGKWSEEGAKEYFEFFEDHTFVIGEKSVGGGLTGKWSIVDGNRVKIDFSMLGSTSTMMFEDVSIDGDKMTMKIEGTKAMLIRIKHDSSHRENEHAERREKYEDDKKTRRDNQEFRFEGTMGQAREGFDTEVFKQAVLADSLLDKLIKEHKLVNRWGMKKPTEAKIRIREKFMIKLDGGTVKVSYQDHDKELAKVMLQSIVDGYYQKVRGGGM